MPDVSIKINIEGPHGTAVHNSLLNWLINNKYLKEKKAKLTQENIETESIAGGIALITLILENTLEVFKLTSVFTEWRQTHRAADTAPVAVQINGIRSVLSVKDMEDEKIVRRALSGAPDPRKAACVLIGVSEYRRLHRLTSVKQNLLDLETAITDPDGWGVPGDRVYRVDDPSSGQVILEVIDRAERDEPSTLLVYFAGHGMQDDTRGLLLALGNSSPDGEEGTVPWSDLAAVINHAHSQRCVAILDCCYSGLAIENTEPSSELLKAAEEKSAYTYILAAAHKNEAAWSPAREENSAFTGELIDVLRKGIGSGPDAQEYLSLNAISHAAAESLGSRKRPQPHRHDPKNFGQFPYLRNPAWKEPDSRPRDSGPPWFHPEGWHMPKLPYLRIAAFAIVVAIVAFVGVKQPWKHSTNVGGVSLTQYCNSQNMTVSGNYCLKPVSLKAACNWQYNVNNLNYRFTSKDPNSAICYNSSVTHEAGITDMLHYCTHSTGTPVVIATADNPAYKGTWVCEEKINMNAVCIDKWNQPGVVARKDSSGTWWCYK